MTIHATPIDPHQITAVLLCGGQARRLGGVQKALLSYRGRPLLSWTMQQLTGEVGGFVISANRDLDAYRAFGAAVIADRTPDLGPLGGLCTALDMVRTSWVFACPGDMPFLGGQVVRRLALYAESEMAVYASDGERDHYLCTLLRTDCARALDDYLNSGARSVHGFLREIGALRVEMPDLARCFVNVNDPTSLASLMNDDQSSMD